MTLNDWFADNGATQPWYGYIITPAATYVSATNKTWSVWEGWTGVTRGVFCRVYDHATTTWGNTFLVTTTNELVDDDHGNPSIVRDGSGYFYVFYGSHGSDQRVVSTTNPDDPSSWTVQASISGLYTYPTPILIGGQIWLFMRQGQMGGSEPMVLRKSTALTAGVPTWAASDLVIFDATIPGQLGRTYFARLLTDGTYIYSWAIRATDDDSLRQNVYYFRLKISTGDLSTADGSHTTLAANLPVQGDQADAFYRLIDSQSGGNVTDVNGHCFDSNGNIHISFPFGPIGVTSYNLLHMKFSGGAWSGTDTIVSGIRGAASPVGFVITTALVDVGSGQIESWYPQDPLNFWVPGAGGNMVKKTLSSGGVWGAETPVLNYGPFPLAQPANVYNGLPGFRMIFSERTATETDSVAGYLRMYGFGANGPVPASQSTASIAALATPTTTRTPSTAWSNPPVITLDTQTSGDRVIHDTVMNPWTFFVPSAWNMRFGRLTGNIQANTSGQANFYKGRNQTPARYFGDALNTIITAGASNAVNFRTSIQPLTTGDTYDFGLATSGPAITAGSFSWGSFEVLPGTFLGCVTYQSGTQTIPGSSVSTNITFDTNLIDTSSFHSTVSNTDRIVIPTGITLARISGHLEFTPQAGTQTFQGLKNAAAFIGGGAYRDSQSGPAVLASFYSAIVSVTAGDIFTCIAQTTNAGSNAVSNGWFEIEALPSNLNYALVTTNSGQTITNGSFQTINWETHTADVGGWHSDSVNNTRLTVPAGVSNIRLACTISSNGTTTTLRCKFIKNGADFVGAALSIANDAIAATQFSNFVSPVLAVSPGDYFEVQVLAGVNFNTQVSGPNTWFQAEEVRSSVTRAFGTIIS